MQRVLANLLPAEPSGLHDRSAAVRFDSTAAHEHLPGAADARDAGPALRIDVQFLHVVGRVQRAGGRRPDDRQAAVPRAAGLAIAAAGRGASDQAAVRRCQRARIFFFCAAPPPLIPSADATDGAPRVLLSSAKPRPCTSSAAGRRRARQRYGARRGALHARPRSSVFSQRCARKKQMWNKSNDIAPHPPGS